MVALVSVLGTYIPAGAQQAPEAGNPAAANSAPATGLPVAPTPNYTQPLFMRPSERDYTKPHKIFPDFLKTWEPVSVDAPVTTNSQRLDGLVHDGKIYLSLADAIEATWPAAGPGRFVVFTGGEPMLQMDPALLDAVHARGFEAAIETNGTLALVPGLDWICVSPKAGTYTHQPLGYRPRPSPG